ncbi:MAG TPA: SdrD B-like domain-containing protein, partial [Pirellulales bacterium]|nr:SdrD B-like domain-containing protein [Pirellulales bacterium]
ESLTTVAASPSVSTSASETAGGVVGLAVLSDAATIAGSYNGSGSVTFTLTAPNSTTTTVGTVSVSGNGTYTAPTVTATQVGTYVWHASYSGDGLNNGAIDNGVNESLTTVAASPSVSTSASETAGGVVGLAVLSDAATIAGSYNGSGSVTFTLTAPNSTTTTVGTVAVSGNGSYSAPTVTATQVGTYVWHASYSGDGLNNGAIDNGVNESLTTVKASPAVTTSASETAGGVVGTSILSDSATISGSYTGSGSITFTLTAPNSTTTTVGTVAVSGNGSYSAPTVTATQVGTYVWHASYSGDGLNNAAIDNGVNESLTTVKASPTIATSASETNGGKCGSSTISDSATISGGYGETGSITFTVTAPNNTTTTVGTVSVSGNGTYTSPTVNVTQVGTYVFHATYSGDSLNSSAVDNGVNESVSTGKAGPTITTSASETAGGMCGSSTISDSATLSGGYNETGTITFTVTAPNNTTTTVGTVSVSGNGTYTSPTVSVTQVGTYVFHATYSGDSLNSSAVDNGVNESVSTGKASPTIATSASETNGGICNTSGLTDTATLSGGYNETGKITFTLTAPNGTTTTVGTVTVSGNGSYTSPSVTATQVGTYVFHATYSGDSLNNSAVDNGTNESLTIHPQTGSISGTVYTDETGNGLTPDDQPMAGVQVYIDLGNVGHYVAGDPVTTVGANGNYTFTGLAAGTYIVAETVPTNYVLTDPVLTNNYTITLTTGQNSTNNDFDNASSCGCGMSNLSNVVYILNGTTAVSDLRGNTVEGETVQVSFTIAAGTAPETLSLVSYTAPGSTFVASQAAQQQIFDVDTGVFGPGTYTLTVTIPYSYYQVDFVCGSVIDTFGPANSNIFYSAQNRLFSADNGGTQAVLNNGSTLTGFVYVDPNNSGTLLPTDAVVAGALINLSGTSTTGQSVKQSAMTNYNGMYEFDNLPAGNYSITETQAGNYSNGPDNVGSIGGSEKVNNTFNNIALGTNVDGVNYNFGAVQTTGTAFAANQTATVAFWNSNSGQTLIKDFNGSSNATALSAWLVSNYGNIYGSSAGSNNLTGKTNSQVASYYQSLAKNLSGQLNAATMALALNVYATTSSLSSNVAASFGFAVSTAGLGAATVNIGSSGAAFGLDDDVVVTISELLYLENQRAVNGVLWDVGGGALTTADLILQAQAYTLIDGIDNT